ncbi:MAG TPA: hypothetical protein VIG76_12885 [Amnibacterium sp.]|jgi:hypothetical protein|uniref:hypothetical protein n=1 Tax=Amnibacterium sp. TaxID=1872496 RepID=UPI002F92E2A5
MSDPKPIPNNNLQPHPEEAENDAALLAGEPGSADESGREDTGEGFGPLPGDEDDERA